MTDDDIVGIRMTTPGDIKAFARAIEQKVKEIKMLKIGDRVINIDSITYIIDRNVFFNNGTSWVMTEPEIQDLLAALFNEPRVQEYREVSDDEFLTPVEKAIVNTSGKLPVKPKAVKKAKK